jgi:precorrin-6Y C5,15-methyltransferase (decarboxylating)
MGNSEVEKVYIVGIGDDGIAGLSESARRVVEQAELLIGSSQALAVLPKSATEQFVARDDFDPIVELIQQNPKRRIVFLVTGDPLFYGTTRYLYDQVGKERFEILPHVSIMQLAFARVKENWDEAILADLSHKSVAEIAGRIRSAEKVGLFTSGALTPSQVARELISLGLDYFTAYVCENLGSPYERVTQAELAELVDQEFSALNVMILVRKLGVAAQPRPQNEFRLFGNPDECFRQSKPKRGLLTPAEIRSVALAEMNLTSNSIVWDVGAGSGSLAIEAAQIAVQGKVYALEMDIDDFQLIGENATTFGTTNLQPVLGKAPEVWQDIPDPDAIFLGGTGRALAQLFEQAWQRLNKQGTIVAHMSSIENLNAIRESAKAASAEANVWMMQFSRGNLQMESLRFESVNPTFLVSATKR